MEYERLFDLSPQLLWDSTIALLIVVLVPLLVIFFLILFKKK